MLLIHLIINQMNTINSLNNSIEETWDEKCAHPDCNVRWTHKTERTLFWCDCLEKYCSCVNQVENGLVWWCKDHLPSHIKQYVVNNKNCKDYNKNIKMFLCDDCINHCKSDDCGCVPSDHMVPII